MRRARHVTAIVALLAVVVFVMGCAAPYTLRPGFEERRGEIERIGLYPLVYTQDGKEQRLFGETFARVFYDGAKRVIMTPPVVLEGPDELLEAFEAGGYVLVDSVHVKDLLGSKFPRYPMPSTSAFRAVSGEYDAIIVPTLLAYNEVDAGTEVAQMCLSTCLTGGIVTVSENNMLSFTLDLVDTQSGTSLWTYTAAYAGEIGVQRANYSERLVSNLAKYFPFSVLFKG